MNGWKKSAATLTVLSAMLTACATPPEPQLASVSTRHESTKGNQQLNYQLASGIYYCEFGERVEVQRDGRNANLIELNWQGNRHQLQRYVSASGLPRYEDRNKGLLWIELPWKGVLMDIDSGRPLANECKATSS